VRHSKPPIIEIGPVLSNISQIHQTVLLFIHTAGRQQLKISNIICTETDRQKNGNKPLFFLFVKFLTTVHNEKARLEKETFTRLAAACFICCTMTKWKSVLGGKGYRQNSQCKSKTRSNSESNGEDIRP
jgi:hypothetical protein